MSQLNDQKTSTNNNILFMRGKCSKLLDSNINTYNNDNVFNFKVELWKVKYNDNNTIYDEFDILKIKRLKVWLRNRIGEERLVNLTLLNRSFVFTRVVK